MSINKNNYIISITSVPYRLNTTLPDVLQSYENLGFRIVVNIPETYRKKWAVEEEKIPPSSENIIINRCSKDWGPATKLLGTIEWCNENNITPLGIITVDDDTVFDDPLYAVESLILESIERPDTVITRGAIITSHPPYTLGNGLIHNVCDNYADGVAGFLGVYYPFNKFNNRTSFELLEKGPNEFYSEDDAYFGGLASKLKCPVWSSSKQSNPVMLGTPSAVEYDPSKYVDRVKREARLYSYLVERKLLPNPHRN